MQAFQQRFERWEYQNQQRLIRFVEISRKQIHQALQISSFLVYLTYQGVKLMMKVFGTLWIGSAEVDQRLAEAQRKRLELSTLPPQWPK